jgi:large subunit ribosomal protein L21
MYAIVESGGKQFKVSPGQTVKVEKLSAAAGEDVSMDKVLIVKKEDTTIVGTPYVSGAKVIASVEGEGRARKVIVHKQRPRKVYRKTNGHRQAYTSVKIKEIVLEG